MMTKHIKSIKLFFIVCLIIGICNFFVNWSELDDSSLYEYEHSNINSTAIPKEEIVENTVEDGYSSTILNEDEFWDYIDVNIEEATKDTGLIIYMKTTNMPYKDYWFTPGIDPDGDGQYERTYLSYEEYLSAIDTLKTNLYTCLNKVSIEKPKSIFDDPTIDILSLRFHACNIKGTSIVGDVPVGCYQIRIVDYYYGEDFVQLDYLDEFEY